MVATHESSEVQFDADGFSEKLRVASVKDQKNMDTRYVWKDEGIERSGYPQSSQECLRLVAVKMQNNPSQTDEILRAVDKFLDQSIGLDRIKIYGVIDRKDDMAKLWQGNVGKTEFYRD